MSRRRHAVALALVAFALGLAGCGQVPVPSAPAIFEVTPATVAVGQKVEVYGQGFGAKDEPLLVSVHGATVEDVAFSDTEFSFVVPSVPPGDTVMVVTVGGRASVPVPLTVRPSS